MLGPHVINAPDRTRTSEIDRTFRLKPIAIPSEADRLFQGSRSWFPTKPITDSD